MFANFDIWLFGAGLGLFLLGMDQLERGVVAVLFQLAGLGQRAGGFCGQSVADFSERPDLPAVGDGGPLPGELLSTEESQLV